MKPNNSCFSDNSQSLSFKEMQELFIALSSQIESSSVANELAFDLFVKKKFNPFLQSSDSDLDEALLTASFYYLSQTSGWFKQSLNWSFLCKFLKSSTPELKWLSMQCVRYICGMSEEAFLNWTLSAFSPQVLTQIRLKYKHLFKRDAFSSFKRYNISCLIKPYLIDIFGVNLLKYSSNLNFKSLLIVTNSVQDNLKSIAASVLKNSPILVEGVLSSGKTSLIEHIAGQTGRFEAPHLIKIQMGNQIDGKLLIGTHCCTDIPGEFIWKPGPLTQALLNGYWLLIEDIDFASADVLTLLLSIIKSKSLVAIPGVNFSNKTVDPRFRIFFTRRTSHGSAEFFNSIDKEILFKLCDKIVVKPVTDDEMRHIITTKWPNLNLIIDRILKMYHLLLEDSQSSNQDIRAGFFNVSSRSISFRDILKWCNRISSYFKLVLDNNQRENLLLDASDCFLQSLSTVTDRIIKAEAIGVQFNIAEKISNQICSLRKPEIRRVNDKMILIGRIQLKRLENEEAILRHKWEPFFSKTQQSMLLLERLACCVNYHEPVLLVGETGTGKTSTVQFLCNLLNRKLVVVNMNQQSDTCDLLGGYKPTELKFLIDPIRKEFDELFQLSFNVKQNEKFLRNVWLCFKQQSWNKYFKIIDHIQQQALSCRSRTLKQVEEADREAILERWKMLGTKVNQMKSKVKDAVLAFSYVEGTLVKCMKNGDWILLDEINLAESETLQCLAYILESENNILYLLDKADGKPIVKHADFRLFACMNPSTDVGKKDLPLGIRNRFSEFFVEELENESDLRILVTTYLNGVVSTSQINKIVQFYLQIRKEAKQNLKDGNGSNPHFSLRTLCRALRIASTPLSTESGSIQRSLYESFCLSFLTQLDTVSSQLVESAIVKNIIGSEAFRKVEIPKPSQGEYEKIDDYWISKGSQQPLTDPNYILTPSISRNLRDLARIVSIGQSYPILIQGETSVGKTSLIKYLAQRSGNICLRVNNHEHTDLQEYVGSYAADESGKLAFKEGVLVQAMRNGYWIILDELNLASTEVLESLNRVLDDNRELFISETQEVVKAHPKFLLFATQNPPGHYGGRKVLSRAFRNRFIELHFDEIPSKELETILHKKCSIPLSYSKKMVSVLKELRNQLHQSVSLSFTGKHGGVTLRDLFRWGERYRLFCETFPKSQRFYDWDYHLACEGYFLLAGRSRSVIEEEVIRSILMKTFNIKSLNPVTIFDDLFNEYFSSRSLPPNFSHLFWTSSLKRLAVLFFQALKYNEPALLVGETGCGKTTICQLFAALSNKQLYSVNCHMHTESSDFIGSIRPIRHHELNDDNEKLFEWVDGPLIQAMQTGSMFLIDEISLADDSVLERINSVIEPERLILMSEKGTIDFSEGDHSNLVLKAQNGFHLFSTMNPGGDYGKKELSPALRNRFTEIWCYSSNNSADIEKIIYHNLLHFNDDLKSKITTLITEYLAWHFNELYQNNLPTTSIRDILSVVNFINQTSHPQRPFILNPCDSIWHSLELVFIDSINLTNRGSDSQDVAVKCKTTLLSMIESKFGQPSNNSYSMIPKIIDNMVYLEPFFIEKGSNEINYSSKEFTFNSPVVISNTQRIFRAMQLSKPILIEGIPGIGKTSLIQAIAKISGYNLIRINLSEQTDISDLFGADLPIEGKEGQFCWRDGPFLQALKSDSTWILLDELNLASQTVLEGLNACLDHRGEVFIPELAKTFYIEKRNVRIFGCQNPHTHGDDRKDLPKSFLNRFTQLFLQPLSLHDLKYIITSSYSYFGEALISKMILFNQQVNHELNHDANFGKKGSPWEFNLRDILRWCQLINFTQNCDFENVAKCASMIYFQRFRTSQDRVKIVNLFKQIFPVDLSCFNYNLPLATVFPDSLQIAQTRLSRKSSSCSSSNLLLLNCHMQIIESLMKCITMNWVCLLVGYSGFGKTSIIHILAQLTGNTLQEIVVNSETDTIELLGGYEQFDFYRNLNLIESKIEIEIQKYINQSSLDNNLKFVEWIFNEWFEYCNITSNGSADYSFLVSKLSTLESIVNKIEKEAKVRLESRNELEQFKKMINSKVSLNSNGSFQWIDSVLITALQHGHWLLIDEVNLCSSSVLDRLNSLLEPNGSLVLNEKGIVNGEIPVIKPHPKFRLFLAMDPKNGELSRAMRNRNVEIFCMPTFDEMDVKIRMRQAGFCDTKIQNLLVSFHLEKLNSGSYVSDEDMSGHYLIQAASKIVMLLENKVNLNQAILSGFENKTLPSSLESFFSNLNLSDLDQYLSIDLDHYYFRRNTRAMIGDSVMHNVLVDWSLFEALSLSKVSDQFGLGHNKFHLFLSTCLAVFFERSSKADIILRQNLFFDQSSSLISITPIQLSKTLDYLSLPFNINHTSSYLPIDLRFNPFAWSIFIESSNKNQIQLAEKNLDQFLINLFWLKLTSIENFVNHHSTSSLMKLSQDYDSAQLDISELSFDAIKYINLTVTLLESKFSSILDQSLPYHVLQEFQSLLLWFHGFKLFLKSNCNVEGDRDKLWDQLVVFWSIFSQKLFKFNNDYFNSDKRTFNKLSNSLGLKSNRFANLLDFKCGINSLSFCQCCEAEPIFLKSMQLIKLLNSIDLSSNKALNIRKWFNILVHLFIKLSDKSTNDWPSLLTSIDQLESEIKETFSTSNLNDDVNERNDHEWNFKFLNRNQQIERHLLPLYYLMFGYFESSYLNGDIDLNNFKDLASRLFLNPLHCLVLEQSENNFNYLNQLTFHHHFDMEKISSSQVLHRLLSSNNFDSNNRDKIDHEGDNEWIKTGYAFDCLPNLTLISVKMLSSNSTLGTMAIKNTQINTLSSYLISNKSILSDFNQFDLIKPHLNIILRLAEQLKDPMIKLKDKLFLNFNPNCNQMNGQFLLSNIEEQPYQVGYFFSIIGLYASFILAPLYSIDPIQKWELKLNQYQLESDYLEIELDARNILSLIKTGFELNPSLEHPLVSQLNARKAVIKSKIDKLTLRLEYRPRPSQYQKLKNDVIHFLETVLNLQKLQEFFDNMLTANSSVMTGSLKEKSRILKEAINIQKSTQNFMTHVFYTYPLYGNMTNGFLMSLCIIIQGLRISTHTLQQQLVMVRNFNLKQIKQCTALLDSIKALNTLANPDPIKRAMVLTESTLDQTFIRVLSKTKVGLMQNLNLLYKSALLDLKLGLMLNPLNDQGMQCLFMIIDCFLNSWLKAEDERKQKKLEEESLFHYKTRTHENELSEEVKEKIEIAKMFPSFDMEFEDLLLSSSSEEQLPLKTATSTSDDHLLLANSNDIIDICDIHETVMNIILTRNSSLPIDFIQSQKFRFQVFSNIFNYLGPLFPRKLDNDSLENHILLCKAHLNNQASNTVDTTFNFYKDPCPQELSHCYAILETIKQRIFQELLPQFSGHPALRQILIIIDRIYDFEIISPLAKFTTGLEILLKTALDWQEVAHKKIKLNQELEAVTQLVIKWRKIELNCWRSCLEEVLVKIKLQQTIKYWFHFYSLIYSALNSEQNMSSENLNQFLSLLMQFMSESSIGQFHSRLQLISNFINHLKCTDFKKKCVPLQVLLSNVYHFYHQFVKEIDAKISSVKTPIEKELKEFVKIMKWTSGNFWDIKSKVEKSHKTLHRLAKKFETSLEFSIQSLLNLSQNELNTSNDKFILPKTVTSANEDKITLVSELEDYQFLKRFNNLFVKTQKYSLKAKKNFKPMQRLINDLNAKVGDVIATIKELQSLTVPANIKEKDKYEKEVRSINNIKRQSFTSLLKTLSEFGILYKNGIEPFNKWTADKVFIDCSFLNQTPQFFDLNTSKEIESCNHYFYCSLFRYIQLKQFLTNPSDELKTISNVIDQIRGISGHLINNVIVSRNKLFQHILNLGDLEKLMNNFKLLNSNDGQQFVSVDFCNEWIKLLGRRVSSFRMLLYQLKELSSFARQTTENKLTNNNIDLAVIDDTLQTLTKMLKYNAPSEGLILVPFSTLQELLNDWKSLKDLAYIITRHHLITQDADSNETVIHHLNKLALQIEQDLHTLNVQYNQHDTEKNNNVNEAMKNLCQKSDHLLRSLLIAVQKLFKFYALNEYTDKDRLEKVIPKLSEDILHQMNIKYITYSTNHLLLNCINIINQNNQKPILNLISTLLFNFKQFFDQYLSLSHYFFTLQVNSLRVKSKLLYVLLNLFTSVVEKGFCLPPGFSSEESMKDNFTFKDLTNAGLGEGEGENDVSNMIENEDQLDETFKTGQEKKDNNENKDDIKDEKDGIEMSEDFDAHAFSPEMNNNDNEEDDDEEKNEDEDEDELDEKMGEVDDSEEVLDEKMWGDKDDEESDNDDNLDDDLDDDEDNFGGEEIEDRLVAKNENKELKEKSKNKNENEKDDKEDGEEINELENEGMDDEYEGEKQDPYKNQPQSKDNKNDDDENILPENMELDKDDSDDGDEDGEDDEDDKGDEDDEGDEEDEAKNQKDDEIKNDIEYDDSDLENKKDLSADVKDQKDEDNIESSDEADQEQATNIEELQEYDDDEENEKEEENQIDALNTSSSGVEQHVPDSELCSNITDNVQMDPKYDKEEKSNNESSNDVSNKDEHGGGSCKPGPESESHEGKVESSTVYEKDEPKLEPQVGPKLKKRGNRSLDSSEEMGAKRKKIIENYDLSEHLEDNKGSYPSDSQLYQHCDGKQTSKHRAIDTADEEDAFKSKPDQTGEEVSEDVKMDDNIELEPEPDVDKKRDNYSEKKQSKKIEKDNQNKENNLNKQGVNSSEEAELIDTPNVSTLTVPRGPISQMYTKMELIKARQVDEEDNKLWFERLSQKVSTSHLDVIERNDAWSECEKAVIPLVYQLCAQLQLVLEPMKAAKLKGDYRSGKRLNMRKVIEYIASQYRKDKIWMRRTKPSKRQYQIILAIDDSSSMTDNQSKRMAFESIALLGKSLSLIEAGDLALMSFGEEVKLLHPFEQPFTCSAGSKLLSQLSFNQRHTRIAELLDKASALMFQSRMKKLKTDCIISQLLLIISDGRGLFNEGETAVRTAIRNIQDLGIFTVFVVLDNSDNQDSILDIKVPIFDANGSIKVESYMDKFPFSFYIILRDINNLPKILGEALRKWFELVLTTDR